MMGKIYVGNIESINLTKIVNTPMVGPQVQYMVYYRFRNVISKYTIISIYDSCKKNILLEV